MEKNELFEGLVGRTVPANQEEYSLGGGDRSSSVTFPVIFSTLVAVSGSYAFGNAVGYSSPVANGIMEDLGLSVAEYGVFGSAITVGGMLGALFSGKTADLVGRRGAMGISDIFCITGWLAILFSKDALWLDLGRFLVGCGSGVSVYVVPVYVAEITTKDIRGAFTSLNIAKNDQTKEFETSLQHLRGKNADISKESADIRGYTEYLQQNSEGGLRDLFQQKYKNSMIVGVGLLVFQQLTGLNGFSYYASFIFESAGINSTVGSIAVAALQISMCIMGVLFIDKSGRRPLLLISSVGTCLGCFITGFSFFLQVSS
ncbi:General substrate transporter [Corchorus olitorius]|uniref:General substrate transporter n=1 Tax=Corchorus olitorius TaxID=93759 RepID=A0A1R3JWI5_9ROSI|nr:General substrate transporter [Corchorus olitorius]